MRRFAAAAFFALVAAGAFAQDASIHETKFKYEKALKKIPGVLDVSVGGINGVNKIVVRVESKEARETVATLCGEKLDGHPVHFLVSGTTSAPEATETTPGGAAAPAPPADCAHCACPCHRGPGKTQAGPRPPDAKFDPSRADDAAYAIEQCDMMRQVLGLPKRDAKNGIRCEQMLGWTNDQEKIKWVVKEGLPHKRSDEIGAMRGSDNAGVECPEHKAHPNGDIICYTYIKHRQFCPMGMKQLIKDVEKMTPGK